MYNLDRMKATVEPKPHEKPKSVSPDEFMGFMKYKAYNTGRVDLDERSSLSEAIKDAVDNSVLWTNNLPQCGYLEVAIIVRIPNNEISWEMLEQARVDVAQRSAKVKAELLDWIKVMEGDE